MTQSTPLAAVLPAAARWGWGRYLHSLSRCQGDVAGIDTIRTRRLLPTDSGRSGFVPWSGRDGLPNRRAGIFASVVGARSLSLASHSELGGNGARDLAELSPRLLSVGLRHARQIGGVDVREAEEIVPASGGIIRVCGD